MWRGWVGLRLRCSSLVCVCLREWVCGCAAHKRASVSAVCMQVRMRAFARAHARTGESGRVRAVSQCVCACAYLNPKP